MVFATKQMAKYNSGSSRLSFPDGLGGAQIYADREQYETAKKTAPTTKKLSWMEQREWDQMEEKVQVAETALELAHQALGDPKVIADRHRMAEASKKAADLQTVVDKLYKRWQDLEVKRGWRNGLHPPIPRLAAVPKGRSFDVRNASLRDCR